MIMIPMPYDPNERPPTWREWMQIILWVVCIGWTLFILTEWVYLNQTDYLSDADRSKTLVSVIQSHGRFIWKLLQNVW